MYKPLFILALLAVILSFASCSDDPFSQVVEIELPEHQPLMTVSMEIEAGDTTLTALVSISRGVLDNSRVVALGGGQVAVWRNGSPWIELDYVDQLGLYKTVLDTPVSDEVATYQLKVSHPDYDPVEATQTMLPPPQILDITGRVDAVLDTDGYRQDEVVIELLDDSSTEDYYGFKVQYPIQRYITNNDTVYHGFREVYLRSNDPLLVDGFPILKLLQDKTFSGQGYQVRLLGNAFYSPSNSSTERPRTWVKVFRMSEAAYSYSRSLEAYLLSTDNPFSEPVTVRDNIEGGYGIFLVMNSREYQVVATE